MVEQVCRLEVVDRDFEDYRQRFGVECWKYDEDVREVA